MKKPNRPKLILPKRKSPIVSHTSGHTKTQVKQVFSRLADAKQQAAQTKNQTQKKSIQGVLKQWKAQWQLFLLYTKLFFTRGSVGRTISGTVVRIVTITTVCGLLYLMYLDTYFVIRNVTVQFTPNSYLEESQIKKVLSRLQNDRVIGLFPTNSYWFTNSESFTAIGKSVAADIRKVTVVKRDWPNTIRLEIDTVPIVATLSFQNKSYILSRDGQVLGEDIPRLQAQVITLNSFSTPATFLTTEQLQMNEQNLLNKVFFALFLQNQLAQIPLPISQTIISSNLPNDPDVILVVGKTRLLFAVDSISRNTLVQRIESALNGTELTRQITTDQIAYIDMRFPKNMYVCNKDAACALNPAL